MYIPGRHEFRSSQQGGRRNTLIFFEGEDHTQNILYMVEISRRGGAEIVENFSMEGH